MVQLLALSKTEQSQILQSKGFEDAEDFLEQAERRELGELLGNAQTLLMLAAVSGRGIGPLVARSCFNELRWGCWMRLTRNTLTEIKGALISPEGNCSMRPEHFVRFA